MENLDWCGRTLLRTFIFIVWQLLKAGIVAVLWNKFIATSTIPTITYEQSMIVVVLSILFAKL